MKIKIKEFKIRYIGTEPFDENTLTKVLIDYEFDEGGILEVKETEPKIEICSACGGIGNVDEGAGFNLDCNKCGGTGYTSKE